MSSPRKEVRRGEPNEGIFSSHRTKTTERVSGIQPNYIRTLELTLGWLLHNSPGDEAKLAQLLPDLEGAAHQTVSGKDAAAADALHSGWRNSIICRQIDQMLSGADIELPMVSSARANQAVNIHGPYQSPPQSAPSEASILQTDVSHPVRSTELPGMSSPEVTLLKLPENSWALLEHYFAFTQAWLPITEKHDVLKLMYNYPVNGLPRTDAVASEHAELWSIMAFSAIRMDTPGAMASFVLCRDIAKSLIPSEQGFELGHIKALLILGLIEIAQEAWITAWLTIGSAIRFLTHLTSGRGIVTRLNQGRTKHTFLAAFLLESAISSRTGALSHLRPDDIRSIGLLIEDGLEEWSPWTDPTLGTAAAAEKSPARSISTFNELVRIALRCHTSQESTTARKNSNSRLEMDPMFRLLGNSSTHPRTLLTSYCRAPTPASANMPYMGDNNTPRSISGHMRSNSNMDIADVVFDQQYPFMSIPNETAESLPSSTPAQAVGATPNMWTSGEASSLDQSNVIPGNDIFEELAMLDRTDSNQNPSFMQNLGFGGFGADMELADFFGADYQWPQNYDSSSKGPS